MHFFFFFENTGKIPACVMPMVAWAYVGVGWLTSFQDARVMKTIAHTPLEFDRMRLTRYDRAVVNNVKLMRSIYRGEKSLALDVLRS